MKTLIRKIAGWIFKSLGGDTVELTREAYRLIVPRGFVIRAPSDSPEYIEWLRAMKALSENPHLKELHASLGAGQRDRIAEEVKTLEEMNLARGTLNAIALEESILSGYVSELEEMSKPKEEFNKFEAI